nr:unnamed protein product [Spirometra erinaceieuropaei]
MLRTLYIFLAIYILRGCPKIMPLVDHSRGNTTTWTSNFTSIRATSKPNDVPVNPFGEYDASFDAEHSRNALSVGNIYASITPSNVYAHVQPRALASTSKQQTGTLAQLVRRWPVFLIAGSIFCAAVGLTVYLVSKSIREYETCRRSR